MPEFIERYATAPVGLFYLDQKLNYLQINPWLAETNGHSVDEHIGRNIRDMIPAISDELEAVFRKVLETGQPVIGGTISGAPPSSPDQVRTFEYNYSPDISEGGEVIGISGLVWEVSRAPASSLRNLLPSESPTSVSKLLGALEHIVSNSGAVGPSSVPPAPEVQPHRVAPPEDPSIRLTAREREVLRAFLRHGTSDGAARQLQISRYTVKNHIGSIMRKYSVGSAVELVCKALGVLGEDVSEVD